MKNTKKAVRKSAEARKKAEAAKVARKARHAGIVIPSSDDIRQFAPTATIPDFRQKGAEAEEFLNQLVGRTFFSLWSYPSPRLPNGNELCDLLVIYDQSAIIWQAKSLKADASTKLARKRETEKNLRQLMGAKKAFLTLARSGGILKIAEPNFGEIEIRPNDLKEVFLISALLGDEQCYLLGVEEGKHEDILHVLDRKEVEILTTELDTASDFIEYFRKKEKWLRKQMSEKTVRMMMPGEEDLLACYLLSGKAFPTGQADWMVVDKHWDEFVQSEKYRRLKEEDKESCLWDYLIKKAQEIALAARSKGDRVQEHEAIVRELARPNRRQRTSLSQSFKSALDSTRASGEVGAMGANRFNNLDISFCFLFMDAKSPKEKSLRQERLGASLQIIRARDGYRENSKVVGIAADIHNDQESTYTFAFLDKPHLTAEDISRACELESRVKWNPSRKRARKVEDY